MFNFLEVKMSWQGMSLRLLFGAVIVLTLGSCVLSQRGETLIKYQIKEELPTNTWVGNIGQSIGLDEQDLEFAFLSESAPHRVYFDLDPMSGELRTAGRIDRDEICAAVMTSCDLSVDVTVRGGGLFQIAKVMVTVEDINDHQPQFPEDRHVLYLSETTQLDAAFALPTAQDADVGMNGIQKYTLAPALPQFELRVGDSECHLVVKQALDREQRAVYALVLTASDGAGNTDSLNVEVTVLDANDNAPSFEQQDYELFVFENAAIGSTILQVHANDPDDGANGEVTYKFSPQSQTQYGGVLRIDSFTGEIVTQAELNYGQTSEYNLRIVAQDQGASSLAGYATITLKIRDLNDHAPQININALTAVPEHSEKGAFVAHVSVSDQDGGDNGLFTCNLDSPNFDLVKMYGTEYKLITAVMFDRESLATYKVRVMCEDLGSPPQEAAESVTVEVSDINDHAPHFPRSLYEVTVAENTAVSSSLVQINVTDDDLGENARVTFSLSGPQSVLAIDPDTGVVTVHRALDHEESSVWEMQVIATDNGSPRPLSSSATLRLIVTDVNDEAPMFPQTTFTFSIHENAPAGSELGEVVAYDRDSPPFNVLQYSIDSAGARYFSVDPVEGTLRALQPLDRESEPVYNFRVEAEDIGGLSSSVQVQVLVQDENDNAPVILVPDNMMQVSAAANIGDIVTHIRASDKDTSQNAQIRYSIAASSIKNLFSLNPLSGALTVAQNLNQNTDNVVTITFRVKDRGEPPLETTSQLNIFVNGSAAALNSVRSSSNLLITDTSVIIIILLSVTGVVSLFLILVIVFLIRRRKQPPAGSEKYRVEPASVIESGSDDTVSTIDGHLHKLNNLNYNAENSANSQINKQRRVHFKDGTAQNLQRGGAPSQIQPEDFGPAMLHPEYKEEARHRLLYGGGSKSSLTQQQLQVHNVLAPANFNIPVAPDQEWERGSSDSGRGASEEENMSADAGPNAQRSRRNGNRQNKRSNPQQSSRRSSRPSASSRGAAAKDDTNSGLHHSGASSTAPPLPLRTVKTSTPIQGCQVHGKPPARPPPLKQQQQPSVSNHKVIDHFPDLCNGQQAMDQSLEAPSDTSTLSGEYVVNLNSVDDVFV